MNRTGSRARLVIALLALSLVVAACSKGSGSGGAYGGGGGYGGGSASGGSGGGASGYGKGGGGGSGYGKGGGGNSGGGGQATGTSVLTVTQANYVFDPATITVKSGDTITIKDTNPNTPHTFTIKGTDIDVANNPMQSQDVAIGLQPGTYEFFCRYHVSSGMKGTITVT